MTDLYTRLSEETGLPRPLIKNLVFGVLYSKTRESIKDDESLYTICLNICLFYKKAQDNKKKFDSYRMN